MYSFNEMVVPLPRPPQQMIFLISAVFTNCNIYVVLLLACIKKSMQVCEVISFCSRYENLYGGVFFSFSFFLFLLP